MSSKWEEATLGEVLEIKYGKDHKKLKDGNIPCYGTGGVMRYVDKMIYDKESILLPRKGSLNNIYFINEPFWTVDTLFWSKINDEKVYPKYVYYFLTKFDLAELNVGSAVPSLTVPVLNNLQLDLPPLPEQKAIAHILGTLDDKIELNRKMNETLEQMAQALFKSWFVDFDPVLDNALAAGNEIPEALKHKAEKRKVVLASNKYKTLPKEIIDLFPSSFVFNEELDKWIPEGWDLVELNEVCDVKGGYAIKSKDFVSQGCPVIKIKNINQNGTINTSDLSYVSAETAEKIKLDFVLEDGDILMAMTGATVGKFGILVKSGKEKYILNQRVAKFFSKKDFSKSIWFVYCYFSLELNLHKIVNLAQGSAQPNISANEIMSLDFIRPNKQVIDFFEEQIKPYFERIIKNTKQIEFLTQQRNTLLPQLISGKLRLPKEMITQFETEQKLAEV